MNKTLDTDLMEYIICLNALKDIAYITAISDHYKPEYFINIDIRIVMDTIFKFYNIRSILPNYTEIKALLPNETEKQSFIKVLQYIQTLDKAYNIDELYENTEKFFREKAVYHALLSTTDKLTKKEINSEEILDTFQQACTISLVDNLGLNFFEEINRMCDSFTKTDNVISTGWKWLDERIGGGWQAEGRALYVFTGFTNVGKSIFLGNIALNLLKQNKNVLLITLEMPEMMYAKRICSNITQIPFSNIIKQVPEMKETIIDFKNEYKCQLYIKEFPTKGATINHLNSYIQKLIKKGFKPDVIVVDYLNLMKGANEGSGTYESVKQVSEQLRASTYLFKIPCITATQLNRKGAGLENPGMETISESIGVSYTSDGQFAIWSDENDKQAGVIHLGIQKNRYGPNFGHTMLKIDYNTLTLTETQQNRTSISDQTLNTANDTLGELNKVLG